MWYRQEQPPQQGRRRKKSFWDQRPREIVHSVLPRTPGPILEWSTSQTNRFNWIRRPRNTYQHLDFKVQLLRDGYSVDQDGLVGDQKLHPPQRWGLPCAHRDPSDVQDGRRSLKAPESHLYFLRHLRTWIGNVGKVVRISHGKFYADTTAFWIREEYKDWAATDMDRIAIRSRCPHIAE